MNPSKPSSQPPKLRQVQTAPLFTGVSSPNVANIPAIWSYTLKVSDLRFQASFNKTNLAMKSTQIPPSVIAFRPRSNSHAEKCKYMTLNQISELMAHAAVMTKNDLSEASKSQIYATDRDEFLDFNAHQSVNTNPSTNKGVRS